MSTTSNLVHRATMSLDDSALPRNWPSPRGKRAQTGAATWSPWVGTLATRPDDAFSCALERDCVKALRGIVAELVDLRHHRGLSMRDAAECAGLPPSVLGNLESGSVWPRLSTLQAVADTYGHVITWDGSPRPLAQIRHRLAGSNVRLLAAGAGLQKQTLYNLRIDGRPLSMKTLLVLTVRALPDSSSWKVVVPTGPISAGDAR